MRPSLTAGASICAHSHPCKTDGVTISSPLTHPEAAVLTGGRERSIVAHTEFFKKQTMGRRKDGKASNKPLFGKRVSVTFRRYRPRYLDADGVAISCPLTHLDAAVLKDGRDRSIVAQNSLKSKQWGRRKDGKVFNEVPFGKRISVTFRGYRPRYLRC